MGLNPENGLPKDGSGSKSKAPVPLFTDEDLFKYKDGISALEFLNDGAVSTSHTLQYLRLCQYLF